MFGSLNISLGIDISESRISVALISKVGTKFKLLKAAECPITPGSIVDGNIEDFAALAKILKDLLHKNRIKTKRAAVSLVAKPILIQILDLPENVPDNIGKHVSSEIRHSQVFAGKDPYYDYCGLPSIGLDSKERVFVAATDNEKVSVLMKTLALAGIEAHSISLSTLAASRAIYEKQIADKFEKNVLVVTYHGSSLTISVYKKGEIDFVRTVDIEAITGSDDEFIMQFVSEINIVIQYYEVEVNEDEEVDWETVIIHDGIAVEAEKFKKTCDEKLAGSVQLCCSNTIYADTPLEVNTSIDAASITAIGHALKSFDVNQSQARVNLLPPETEDVRNTKKYAIITANVAVVVLLGMFASGALIRKSLGKTQYAIEQRKIDDPMGNIEALLKRQQKITEQVTFLSEKKKGMREVFDDYSGIKWHDLLHDIRTRAPVALYLTKLSCSENMTIMMEGNATSFKSIHIFAELLTQSDYFKTASVVKTNKSDTEGLVAFTIRIELAD